MESQRTAQCRQKIIILLPLLGICYYLIWIGYLSIMLLDREKEFYLRLDKLNDGVLTQIGQPEWVEKFAWEHRGGGLDMFENNVDIYHGRWLIVDYLLNERNAIEVLDYYALALQSAGWVVNNPPEPNKSEALYSRDKVCIDIRVELEDKDADKYRVTIWHDYRAWSSTPMLPPMYLLRMDYGHTQVVTCPMSEPIQ